MLTKARRFIYAVRINRHVLAASVLEWEAQMLEERTPPNADGDWYAYGEAMLRLRSQRHADRAARLIEAYMDGAK